MVLKIKWIETQEAREILKVLADSVHRKKKGKCNFKNNEAQLEKGQYLRIFMESQMNL